VSRSRHDGCGGPCHVCSRPEVVARRLARAPQLDDQIDEVDLVTDEEYCGRCEWCDPTISWWVDWVIAHHAPALDALLEARDDWERFKATTTG
jgi:hypothetical protein